MAVSPTTTTHFRYVWGVAALQCLPPDASGNVYVNGSFQSTLNKFAAGSTTPVALTGVVAPTALALDASGDLFVGGDEMIVEFPPGYTNPSATLTSPALSGIDLVSAMTFDASGTDTSPDGVGNTVRQVPAGSNHTCAAFAHGLD